MTIEDIKLIGYIALFIAFLSISIGSVVRAISEKKQNKKFHPIRQTTFTYLRKLRVPFNPALPMYTGDDCKIKNSEQIVKRILALSVCFSFGNDFINNGLSVEEKKISRLEHIKKLTRFDLKNTLTPNEKLLFTKPTKQLLIDLSWQGECIPHLAYALGLIDWPPYPDQERDWSPLIQVFLKKKDVNEVLKQVKPISKTEILKALDMFFCLRWACNEQILKGKKVKFANEEVVREQFRTYIWLTSDEDEWDDIDTSA